jgi:hypothetical protein
MKGLVKYNINLSSWSHHKWYLLSRFLSFFSTAYTYIFYIKTTRDCVLYCKLQCSSKISNDEGKSCFKSYHALPKSEKRQFPLQSTERFLTACPRTENTQEGSCSSKSAHLCNWHDTHNREENPQVADDRKKGVKEMLKCMPMQNRQCYFALLHIQMWCMSLRCKFDLKKNSCIISTVHVITLLLNYCSVKRVTDFLKTMNILTLHITDL